LHRIAGPGRFESRAGPARSKPAELRSVATCRHFSKKFRGERLSFCPCFNDHASTVSG
jgi:hypothetical protein